MRFVALFFIVCAALGCKGKQSDKAKANEGSGSATYSPEAAARRAGPGFVPVRKLAAKLLYTPTEVSVDGETAIEIKADGVITEDQFQTLTHRIEDKITTDDPIGILLDAGLPYARVSALIGALSRGGFHKLALLGGGGGAMVPLDIIDSQIANAGTVRPIITVNAGTASLWSITGKEGTKQAPKLTLQTSTASSFAPITKALADIVKRNWPIDTRGPEDRTIILQIDGQATADVLLRLCAAARSDGTKELFGNLFLAGGA